MRELLAELVASFEQRIPFVYCTVVATRGSTPQKAGAAKIVYPDGRQSGTLGGGCVEADVKRRALLAFAAGSKPEVCTFTLDDDYGWDDGLICGGRMTIVAHPIAPDRPGFAEAARYYHQLQELVNRGDGFTEAVAVDDSDGASAGNRILFDAAGNWDQEHCLPEQPDATIQEIASHLMPVATRPRAYSNRGTAYLPCWPRVTVFLVGAGHVGQAVARLAAEVGFDIWVLDDRERFASAERFSSASRRLVGDIGSTLRDLAPKLTRSTFAVILTRGHSHDEEALYHLAGTACGYVGMIGSKRKIRMIFDDLIAKGISAETLARVHAPLGFAIGSQTVPEIAVSIVAELIACRNLANSLAKSRSGTGCCGETADSRSTAETS
jgi:xanthine dehydrogenase accessory factor